MIMWKCSEFEMLKIYNFYPNFIWKYIPVCYNPFCNENKGNCFSEREFEKVFKGEKDGTFIRTIRKKYTTR